MTEIPIIKPSTEMIECAFTPLTAINGKKTDLRHLSNVPIIPNRQRLRNTHNPVQG